jgi:hypothetical protein
MLKMLLNFKSSLLKHCILLGCICSLFSCKKDKLTGEYSALLGKWQWAYSIYEYDKCQQTGGLNNLINPVSEGRTFQIEFLEKGKVKFFENDLLLKEYRVVIDAWQPWSGMQPFPEAATNFVIYLNNDEETSFSGLIAGDSIFTFRRPFEGAVPLCDDYLNYWGRIE